MIYVMYIYVVDILIQAIDDEYVGWCKHEFEYVGVNLWNLHEACFVVVES